MLQYTVHIVLEASCAGEHRDQVTQNNRCQKQPHDELVDALHCRKSNAGGNCPEMLSCPKPIEVSESFWNAPKKVVAEDKGKLALDLEGTTDVEAFKVQLQTSIERKMSQVAHIAIQKLLGDCQEEGIPGNLVKEQDGALKDSTVKDG